MGVYTSDGNGNLKKFSGITRVPQTIAAGLPLGLIIPAAVVSDDTNLQLLDGSCIAQNGMYAEFCTWLKSRINANASNVPTCTISEYATQMTTYGQCGKFVINDGSSDLSSNGYTVYANSIKLPTITEFIASNNGGDSIGLAELDELKSHNHSLVLGSSGTLTTWGAAISKSGNGLDTYAVRSSGGEETRPKNIRYPYYIVVATGLKLAVVANMDGVTNDIKNINNTLNRTEQVEVVYDKDNPNKDWGYSGGLQSGITVSGKNFSKYKGLIVYCTRYRIGFEGYVNFEQDLPSSAYVYAGSAVTGIVDGTTPYWTLCRFFVNSEKTNFVVEGFWQNGALKTEDGYIITKIKGVY